jgi:DinB family protein
MAAMTDEDRRIRSYLTAQSAKLQPAEIVEKVRTAMATLDRAACTVPAARFTARPSPEDWSASEVLAHVVDSGRRVTSAILRLLEGGPGGPLPEREAPAEPLPSSAAGWRDLLAREREALFARVLAAAPDAHLDHGIEVSNFGSLNWREALLFLRLHDLDHAGQLEKIGAALA